MTHNILVSVACPTPIRTSMLEISPALICRLIFLPVTIDFWGNRVLMVSGSDAHGTPVSVRADAEGNYPIGSLQKISRFLFLELYQKLGISYDLFTSTHTQNHFKVSQTIFIHCRKNGYLYTQKEKQWFAPSQGRFLPDRYIEGTCSVCATTTPAAINATNADAFERYRIDQSPLKVDGSTPELRENEHFYLDLGKLQDAVVAFLREKESYGGLMLRQSLGQILANGLHGRAITRDLDWVSPFRKRGGR